MVEIGMGSAVAVLEVLGAGIAFVIIWILKSEKMRKVYEREMVEFKRRLEAQEREKSILLDKLEESQSTIQELEEGAEQLPSSQEGEQVEEMGARIKELESENEKLYEELAEAKESLEEVFAAVVHEEA